MKLFTLLVSLVLLGATTGQEFREGKRTGGREGRAIVFNPSDICSNDNRQKSYCNADSNCDATGLIRCTGAGVGFNVPCTGSSRYCIDSSTFGQAKCSSKPDEACPVDPSSAPDYICWEQGIFPDPLDCRKYYECAFDDIGDLVPYLYECDDLYVFDPNAANIKYCRLTRGRYCVTAPCKGEYKNVELKYPTLPKSKGQLIATCLGDENRNIVTRCEAGFEADMSSLPPTCELKCRGAGLFAYPGDDSFYYQCLYTAQGWQPKKKSCYRGEIFNKTKRQCEKV